MAAVWLALGVEWHLALVGVVLLAACSVTVNFWLWRRDQRRIAPAGDEKQA